MSPIPGPPPWWVSAALLSLRDEVNEAWPNRDKTYDGTIGDAAHAARGSDHNPLPDGEVCALDITTVGIDAPWLAEHLAALAPVDPRVKYVIFNRRIFDLSVSPDWRPYTGEDPHTDHIHLSVHPNAAATPSWGVAEGANPPPPNDTPPTPTPEEPMLIIRATGRPAALVTPSPSGPLARYLSSAEWQALYRISVANPAVVQIETRPTAEHDALTGGPK